MAFRVKLISWALELEQSKIERISFLSYEIIFNLMVIRYLSWRSWSLMMDTKMMLIARWKMHVCLCSLIVAPSKHYDCTQITIRTTSLINLAKACKQVTNKINGRSSNFLQLQQVKSLNSWDNANFPFFALDLMCSCVNNLEIWYVVVVVVGSFYVVKQTNKQTKKHSTINTGKQTRILLELCKINFLLSSD